MVSIPSTLVGQVAECAHCNHRFKVESKAAEPSHLSNTVTMASPPPEYFGSNTMPVSVVERNPSVHGVPLKLKAMKIATILWLISMIFCTVFAYKAGMSRIVFIDQGWIQYYQIDPPFGKTTTLEEYRAATFVGAVAFGLIWPTVAYVPTMIALFVFWFIDRESKSNQN